MEQELFLLRQRVQSLENLVNELQRKVDAKDGIEMLSSGGGTKQPQRVISFSGQNNVKDFFVQK